jgi:hypothetical protein
VCEVFTQGDALVFRAPELELAMGYLAVRAVAERVELGNGELKLSPALPEVAAALKALCDSDASSVLLDIKDSLLHMGWLVEGAKDVTKMRKSRRAGVGGFTVVEYDKTARKMTVFTTQTCLAEALKQLGFEVASAKNFLEATRRVSTLVEALKLEEEVSQASC